MPEQQVQQAKPIQPFENVAELQSEQFLKDMDALGVMLPDRALRKEWAKDKLRKGFPLQIIEQSLKANKYDFDVVGKYLDTIYNSKQQAEQALKEVRAMKQKDEDEKKMLKKQTHLSWIIGAFMLAGVGAGSSWFIKNQTGELDISGAGTEMATGMLDKFIQGGWVIAIATSLVGLLLTVFALNDYFKEKSKIKKEQQAAVQQVETAINTQIYPSSQNPAK